MEEIINIIKSWIEFAAKKSPEKIPGFFLLWDYAALDFSAEFYKQHFTELSNILIDLDSTKDDVQIVTKFIQEAHYV